MNRCPACFSYLAGDVVAWMCSSTRCEPAVDETASRFAGYEVVQRNVVVYSEPAASQPHAGWPLASVECTKCGDQASLPMCPFCHYGPLPDGWRGADVTCVAMTGARDSGKSVYIAIAVHQLQQYGSRFGYSVAFADDKTKDLFTRKYAQPLLEERGIIGATSREDADGPTRLPLIFSLGLVDGRRKFLVLRDIDGETLQAERAEHADELRFLANADCVLFLFDPVKVTSVRDLLHDLIPESSSASGDPRAVLNYVLRTIGGGSPRLAVVLAKFDTMEMLRTIEGTAWTKVMANAGSAMLRDPSTSSTQYDEHDGGLLDQEIRSLLLRLNAADLVNALERPTNGHHLTHRYFAASMLGEPLRADKVSTRGIKPFRCLDPLRWVLAATDAPTRRRGFGS